VQVIDWKDSSPKWPVICWWDVKPYSLTHSLTFRLPLVWRHGYTEMEPTHTRSAATQLARAVTMSATCCRFFWHSYIR